MAFKYLPKYDQLNRFAKENSAVGSTKSGAGAGSRARTQKMIGLGQSMADETTRNSMSSAQGVRRMFDQVDIKSSRGEEDVDFQMASWIQSIEEERQENAPDGAPEPEYDSLKLTEELYGKKGVQAGKAVAQSYFDTPIISGELRGNSRKAGDVSPEVQQEVVNRIVEYGSRLEMTDYQIAYALATARFESGFNPDAAAKTTSARGIGQFVDKTGSAYGITKENQWDVDIQIQALLEHTRDNFRMAEKKGYGNEYVYAIHHDGPALDKGGLALSKKNVMPYVPKYLELIKNYRGE